MPEIRAAKTGMPFRRRAIHAASVEILFVLLPLVVLSIVLTHEGRGWWGIISSPEWSFAAAIFMGQSIVKVVQGAAAYRIRPLNPEAVAFIVALLIVLGLVPSLIVLALMLTQKPPSALVVAQMTIFAVSAGTFALLAYLGTRLQVHQHTSLSDRS